MESIVSPLPKAHTYTTCVITQKNTAYLAIIDATFVIFPVGGLEKEMPLVLLELVTKNAATWVVPT
jgi:hypothetical protein